MSSLTVTVDVNRSWVRLDLDVSDVAPIPTVTITRTRLDTGATATVRPYGALSSGLAQPVGGKIVMYDVECPNDAQVQYTATYNSGTGLVRLNVNPGAENGVLSPWSAATAGTLAVSQLQAQSGYWAFQFTPDGVTANPAWQSEEVPAVVGKTYTVAGQLWSTSAATWSVGIRWFDAAHSPLSISTFNVALTGGVWTAYSNTAVAPASAAFARIYVQASGTPAGANILYGDQLTISTPINVSVTSATVIDPSNGFGWLIDPTRPYANVRLDMTRRPIALGFVGGAPGQGVAYLGLAPKTRRAMGGPLDVNNAAAPVAVTRVRRTPNFDLQVVARGFPDRDAVNALLATGTTVLLQLPVVYGEPDRYLWVGDTTEGAVLNDQRRQPRLLKAPATEVSSPVGPMLGTTGERIVDLGNHYPTWGALAAGAAGVYDSFSRVVAAGGWGAPDNGPTAGYTITGTASYFSVAGGLGVISPTVRNTTQYITIGSYTDTADVYATLIPSVIATGSSYQLGIVLRFTNPNNVYFFTVDFGLTGTATPQIGKSVAGSFSTIKVGPTFTYTAGGAYRFHVGIVGTLLTGSVWNAATGVEPGTPTMSVTDAGLAGPGAAGLFHFITNTNTNTLPVVGSFDDFLVVQGPTWQQVMDGAVA